MDANPGTSAADSSLKISNPSSSKTSFPTSEDAAPKPNNDEEDSAEVRESNKNQIGLMDQEKSIVETKTKIILTIDSDKVYRFKVPKAEICLADVKKYLMKKPERYLISEKGIYNYEFRAKTTTSEGKDCYDIFDEEDDDMILPFSGNKIILECWSS